LLLSLRYVTFFEIDVLAKLILFFVICSFVILSIVFCVLPCRLNYMSKYIRVGLRCVLNTLQVHIDKLLPMQTFKGHQQLTAEKKKSDDN